MEMGEGRLADGHHRWSEGERTITNPATRAPERVPHVM